jgi:hypothetical protein
MNPKTFAGANRSRIADLLPQVRGLLPLADIAALNRLARTLCDVETTLAVPPAPTNEAVAVPAKLKDEREREFVGLCILVAHLAREFPKRISTQQKMVKRLKDDKAITALRSFVSEHVGSRSNLLIPRLDPFPMWGFFQPPDDAVAMMRGLELIAEVIKKQKTVMAELGATRKKNIKKRHILRRSGTSRKECAGLQANRAEQRSGNSCR